MTVVLVRHAEPVAPGAAGHEENDRPLSDSGREQAEQLADTLASRAIGAVYSSPYPRARQTVEPLAARLGVPVTIVPDLRERLLGRGPIPDWLDHVRRSWADFSYALGGGESSAQAQARAWRVIEPIAVLHRDNAAVVASHGNLIALVLHRILGAGVDFRFWQAMPVPAVYTIEPDGRVTGPGLEVIDAAAADPTWSMQRPP